MSIKKCAPKLKFFNEKKNEKDSNDFLHRLKLRHFLKPPLHQFSKFDSFFWVCWFLGKNLSNFVPTPRPPLENLTTRITIV